MHPRFEKANGLSHEAIGAAIEVHRILGPGLLELKTVQDVLPIGRLLNFHEIRLIDGLSRMILLGANQR